MKRILVIHPEGNINNNPSLSSFARLLREQGYAIDVVSSRRESIYQRSTPWYRLITLGQFDSFLSLVRSASGSGSFLARLCLRTVFSGYAFIFGVDRDGIIAASVLSEITRTPYALISYEIFFAAEVGEKYKEDERAACARISFAICQDEVRSCHLAHENDIPLHKIINIPLSAGGSVVERRGSPLKGALGIPPDAKVALFMGSLSDWSGVDELISNVEKWPAEWVLLLHSRYKDEKLKRYLTGSRNAAGQRIYLSSEPFPDMDDLYELLSVADLGIAIYKPTYRDKYSGKNLEYIGLSSGKVSMYVQCGVPVLMNEVGLLSDVVRRYDAGYVALDAGAIHAELGRVNPADLPVRKKRAHALFNEIFSLKNYSENLLLKVAQCGKTEVAQTLLPKEFHYAVLQAAFRMPLDSFARCRRRAKELLRGGGVP